MTATVDSYEPNAFRIGDTVKWTKSLPDYVPTDSWVLTYSFANASSQIDVVASDNGDGTHLITISAAVSATFSAAKYRYQAYVEKGSERFTVSEGSIQARAALTAAVDDREHAEQMVDLLESVMAGRAGSDAMAVSVGGKTVSMLAPKEIYEWLQLYRAEVDRLKAAERLSQGLGSPTMIRVRMQ